MRVKFTFFHTVLEENAEKRGDGTLIQVIPDPFEVKRA